MQFVCIARVVQEKLPALCRLSVGCSFICVGYANKMFSAEQSAVWLRGRLHLGGAARGPVARNLRDDRRGARGASVLPATPPRANVRAAAAVAPTAEPRLVPCTLVYLIKCRINWELTWMLPYKFRDVRNETSWVSCATLNWYASILT